MTMLNTIALFALGMSALNWLLFLTLTIKTDLPQLSRLFEEMMKPVATTAPLERTQLQAAVDPTKIAAATGSLAGAFKKAGAAPTAAAMSVMFLLIALVAAGVGKF